MKRRTREHMKTVIVGDSQLELYLCSRVERDGKSYVAYQDDEAVEFDRRRSMADLAAAGAALANRELRERHEGILSNGPIEPSPTLRILGEDFRLETAPRDHRGCYHANIATRLLSVRLWTRPTAIVWGIGAVETAWMGLEYRNGTRTLQPAAPAPAPVDPGRWFASLLRQCKAHRLGELVEDIYATAAELGYEPQLFLALALSAASDWDEDAARQAYGRFTANTAARFPVSDTPPPVTPAPEPLPESLPAAEREALAPDFNAAMGKLFGDGWQDRDAA